MKDHEASVKVENPKSISEGNLLMSCDVILCGYVRLIGCRLWRRKEDGSRFVSLPQRSYEAEGETRYAPTVKLHSEGAMKEISRAVIAAHDQLGGSGQTKIPTDDPFSE